MTRCDWFCFLKLVIRSEAGNLSAGLTISGEFMYRVPKLTDYSLSALDAAARDLLSALDSEATGVNGDNEYRFFRDRWMARKDGITTQLNDLWLKAAPKEAKRDAGQRVNELKTKIEAAVEATLERLRNGASSGRLEAERIDI